MKYAIFSILLLILVLSSVQAATAPPKPGTGNYVADFANILPDKDLINQELLDYEKKSTIEIVLVTIESLPQDQTLETLALQILTDWGVGKKDEDNGIVVLINKNGTPGNRLRIETGYGIEGYINDAKAGRVLDEALPSYTARNYSEAAKIVLDGIKENLKDYEPGKKPKSDNWTSGIFEFLANIGVFLFFIMIFGIVGFFGRPKCPQCKSKKLKSDGDYYICKKCGKKFKKPKDRRGGGFIIAGGSGGFGGGGGGFGGGGGGGGGASRFYK